jgi:hypothetical protein
LLTLQSDIDQTEEARARLDEEVLAILQSDFVLDGRPALTLPKHHSSATSPFCQVEDQILLSALRQLASVLRGLNDKKNALERALVSSTVKKNKEEEDPLVLEESGESDNIVLASEEDIVDGGHLTTTDFHPQRLDSFGLETIIEEERNDEEQQVKVEELEDVFQDVPKIDKIDSSVQTEEELLEQMRSALSAQFESKLLEKEGEWRKQVRIA